MAQVELRTLTVHEIIELTKQGAFAAFYFFAFLFLVRLSAKSSRDWDQTLRISKTVDGRTDKLLAHKRVYYSTWVVGVMFAFGTLGYGIYEGVTYSVFRANIHNPVADIILLTPNDATNEYVEKFGTPPGLYKFVFISSDPRIFLETPTAALLWGHVPPEGTGSAELQEVKFQLVSKSGEYRFEKDGNDNPLIRKLQ